MEIMSLIKNILFKINPSYRVASINRVQLENIQNLLIEMNNNLKMLSPPQENDEQYLHADVPLSQMVSHSKWRKYLAEIGNKKDIKILEVGSRVVVGSNLRKSLFPEAKYIGFDFYAGDSVDIVGDAHKLSSYFDKDEKFDIILSNAVFEHLAMPWIVVKEMAKLLKVNGYIFVETHFSYSSHERPWHFFQYSDMALKVLFSPAMGFECIEAGMSNPIVGRFSSLADGHLQNKRVTGLYCHAEYFGKKVKEVENFDWIKMNLADVVGESKYPKPNG